jgi:hypothetical protein
VNARERWRLANLQGPCVDVDFLQETHGVAWPPDEQFERDFRAWFATISRPTTCGEGKAHRYAFEMFLQSQRLLTRAYAAARLGMQPESLDQLLPALPRLGLSKRYAVYCGIIDESLGEDVVRSLPGLRFRTFGTHDSYCELLHDALQSALGLEIKPLFCATADQLGEQRTYASIWDNITLLPLSVKHSVWLDFKKPLALAPDRCSKLFFAQHYDELLPHLAGRDEPRDLGYYVEFLRRPA